MLLGLCSVIKIYCCRQFFLFITNNHVHNYNTRIAENNRPQACRTNLKQFTILFQGPKIWNALPSHMKDMSSLSTFKKHMIEFLLR
jgi:hypothetical protein